MNGDDSSMPAYMAVYKQESGFTKYEHMVIEFTKVLLPDKNLSIPDCVKLAADTANEVIKQLNQNNGKQ